MVEARRDGVWHPRRTVMFCNWDGEEHGKRVFSTNVHINIVLGLVGSAEFVENYQTLLTQRAVTYLNVDLIYGNGSLQVLDNLTEFLFFISSSANTIPTMYNTVVETAKVIANPVKSEVEAGRKTVYDTWIYTQPGKIAEHPDFPDLSAPGNKST